MDYLIRFFRIIFRLDNPHFSDKIIQDYEIFNIAQNCLQINFMQFWEPIFFRFRLSVDYPGLIDFTKMDKDNLGIIHQVDNPKCQSRGGARLTLDYPRIIHGLSMDIVFNCFKCLFIYSI